MKKENPDNASLRSKGTNDSPYNLRNKDANNVGSKDYRPTWAGVEDSRLCRAEKELHVNIRPKDEPRTRGIESRRMAREAQEMPCDEIAPPFADSDGRPTFRIIRRIEAAIT